jgi:hypothetical protein
MSDNKKHEEAQFLPQFSVFPNCMTTTPFEEPWVIETLVKKIRDGDYKPQIDEIREIEDKEKRNEKKKLLPAITPSGIFLPTRNNANLARPSEIITFDFDVVVNIMAALVLLKKDEFSYLVFLSPSGTGIKVFVRILPGTSRHKKVFNALRKYYKKHYGLEADGKCGDIARLCYLSSDPDVYWNPEASIYTGDFSEPTPELGEYTGKPEDYPSDLLYWVAKDNHGNVKGISIRHARFLQFLEVLGFRRFDLGTGFVFVRLVDNILVEVSKTTIQDAFFDFIKGLPDELPDGVSREMLIEKIVKSPENYFSDMKLSLIMRIAPNFCVDTFAEVRLFFANGFVRCSKDGYTLHPYAEMDGLVWKSQMLKRDFIASITEYDDPDRLPVFAKFVWNVSGKGLDRFRSFLTVIGYLLHDFFEGKARAIILTDSDLSAHANGRTGKTLFGKALAQITPLCEISGKDFDPNDRFKYQGVSYPDRIVHINDIRKNLSIAPFLVDISEGLSVQKKNKQPFHKRTKIIISTNWAMKTEGASERDRVIEIEFSRHYGEALSPHIEFGKWFFGEGWTEDDWVSFDNFICYCVCLYLRDGVHIPSQINLGRRKLLASSNEDFVDFIDERAKENLIRANMIICKNELRDDFLKEYPEYKETLKDVSKITVWLRSYANFSGYFAPNNNKQDEKSSDGKKYFVFRPVGYKRTAAIKFVPPHEELGSDLNYDATDLPALQ